ncbi:MAG: hypothetical protein ACR2O1_00900 [Boseongicola sp.]
MADDPSVKAGTGDARLLLESGEKALRDLLVAFDLLSEQVHSGDVPAERDLSRACVTLARVRSTLMEEIQKHERRVLMSEGLTDNAPIDFNGIRKDIGRRIDRLVKQEKKSEVP